jgi:hypothetical protein
MASGKLPIRAISQQRTIAADPFMRRRVPTIRRPIWVPARSIDLPVNPLQREARVYRRILGLVALTAAVACDGDSILEPGSADPFRGCSSVFRISVGANVNGSLTTNDCQDQGYFTDYYEFELNSGRDISIDLASNQFDSFLELYDRETGDFLGDDDNSGFGDNAQLRGFLPAGTYVIAASSFFTGETGDYSLAVQ